MKFHRILGLVVASVVFVSCSSAPNRRDSGVTPEQYEKARQEFRSAVDAFAQTQATVCNGAGGAEADLRQCIGAEDGGLHQVEVSWGVLKSLAERILAANQVNVVGPVTRELYRHYIDTVQAWVVNGRRQQSQFTGCLGQDFSAANVAGCLVEGEQLRVDGNRLAREIQSLAQTFDSA